LATCQTQLNDAAGVLNGEFWLGSILTALYPVSNLLLQVVILDAIEVPGTVPGEDHAFVNALLSTNTSLCADEFHFV
jgi:hypothetical protein